MQKFISKRLPLINKTLLSFFFFFLPCVGFSETLQQHAGVLHVQTDLSSGTVTPEQVVKIARSQNTPVLMFAESALRQWEYTLWPEFGPLIRKKVEEPSVLKGGASNYLLKIDRLQKKNPEILLFPGLEVAPYYYWEGNPFHHNLVLRDWHKHLLVFGLEKATKIKNLPISSNKNRFVWKWKNIFWLWPLLTFLFGFRILNYKKKIKFKHLVVAQNPYRKVGAFIMLLSLVPMVINFPFTGDRFSPMSPGKGAAPYQKFINDVRKMGGLVFWAHPEAGIDTRVSDDVRVKTDPYPELLLETKGYHGFSIFYEGYRKVGGIGGIWDKVLLQYIFGQRRQPVWAIGETDFHQLENVIPKSLNEVETVFLVPELNKVEVLKAMRLGKMYARRSSKKGRLKLSQFQIDAGNGQIALSGETFERASNINVRARIENEIAYQGKVKIQVIKNGKLWKSFEKELPFEFELKDEVSIDSYYRIFVQGDYPLFLASNPIFAEK